MIDIGPNLKELVHSVLVGVGLLIVFSLGLLFTYAYAKNVLNK